MGYATDRYHQCRRPAHWKPRAFRLQLIDIRQFDDGELCAANERAGLVPLGLRGARLGKPSDVSAVKSEAPVISRPGRHTHTHTLEVTDLNQLLEWVRDDEFDLPVAGDDR
jgi:hypothetical protein